MAHAARRFPCSNWWIARNDPHPGQYQPVKEWTGQGGNIPEVAGSKTRSITMAAAAAASTAASNRRLERVNILLSPL
jgi:hypothetical protein